MICAPGREPRQDTFSHQETDSFTTMQPLYPDVSSLTLSSFVSTAPQKPRPPFLSVAEDGHLHCSHLATAESPVFMALPGVGTALKLLSLVSLSFVNRLLAVLRIQLGRGRQLSPLHSLLFGEPDLISTAHGIFRPLSI